MKARRMSIDRLLAEVRPGSHGDDWTWHDEHADRWARQPDVMGRLVADIDRNGLRGPVMIGDDGRLWDGHHRVVALMSLGRRWVRYRLWSELDDDDLTEALIAAVADAEERGWL